MIASARAPDSALEPYRALRLAVGAARTESGPSVLLLSSRRGSLAASRVAVNYALSARRARSPGRWWRAAVLPSS